MPRVDELPPQTPVVLAREELTPPLPSLWNKLFKAGDKTAKFFNISPLTVGFVGGFTGLIGIKMLFKKLFSTDLAAKVKMQDFIIDQTLLELKYMTHRMQNLQKLLGQGRHSSFYKYALVFLAGASIATITGVLIKTFFFSSSEQERRNR